MTEADKTGRAFSWRRVLFGALACTAVAFGVGCGMGLAGATFGGFDGPGGALMAWLLATPFLAIVAGVFGCLSRRMYIGALGAPVLSLAAAVGFNVAVGLPIHGPDALVWLGFPASVAGPPVCPPGRPRRAHRRAGV